jgi:hypothetical protein
MDEWLPLLLAISTTVIASSGFWTYVISRKSNKSAIARLLMGLAHDKISQQGMAFVDQGTISHDEYEAFIQYLYLPYKELGGNGLADKIKEEVDKLPLTPLNLWKEARKDGLQP